MLRQFELASKQLFSNSIMIALRVFEILHITRFLFYAELIEFCNQFSKILTTSMMEAVSARTPVIFFIATENHFSPFFIFAHNFECLKLEITYQLKYKML